MFNGFFLTIIDSNEPFLIFVPFFTTSTLLLSLHEPAQRMQRAHWKEPAVRKQFFVDLARDIGINPNNPNDWYQVTHLVKVHIAIYKNSRNVGLSSKIR